jgi:hypothetical protein
MKMCGSKESNGMESSLIQTLKIVRQSGMKLMQAAMSLAQGFPFVYSILMLRISFCHFIYSDVCVLVCGLCYTCYNDAAKRKCLSSQPYLLFLFSSVGRKSSCDWHYTSHTSTNQYHTMYL